MLELAESLDLESCTFECVGDLRLPLVNRFYSSCDYRVKCGRFEHTFSLSMDGKIIAAARLIPQKSGCFLLRNLCVAPSHRNRGVASYLVRATLAALGSSACFCYALPHLQHFYTSLGFQMLTPTQVPEDIGAMYIRHRERKRGWLLMGFVPATSASAL